PWIRSRRCAARLPSRGGWSKPSRGIGCTAHQPHAEVLGWSGGSASYGDWKRRLDSASGNREWKLRVETASGNCEWKLRVDGASSIRRFDPLFPLAHSIQFFHSLFPLALSIRSSGSVNENRVQSMRIEH